MLVILILLIILLFYARALSRAKKRAELLATTDDLTQMHNRRYFFLAGERELYSARRHERPITVMRLDVDRFKQVNDRWGHAVGDEVLKTIAKIIKASVRSGDICSRLGGDEFSFLLSETDSIRANLIAERIRCSIAAQVHISGNDILNVTVSVGVAVANREWPTLEELLILSDKALYQAKESGRDRVVVFLPDGESAPAVADGNSASDIPTR